eukprot:364948-Chlamydomonas_euryale.AAC.1
MKSLLRIRSHPLCSACAPVTIAETRTAVCRRLFVQPPALRRPCLRYALQSACACFGMSIDSTASICCTTIGCMCTGVAAVSPRHRVRLSSCQLG